MVEMLGKFIVQILPASINKELGDFVTSLFQNNEFKLLEKIKDNRLVFNIENKYVFRKIIFEQHKVVGLIE